MSISNGQKNKSNPTHKVGFFINIHKCIISLQVKNKKLYFYYEDINISRVFKFINI